MRLLIIATAALAASAGIAVAQSATPGVDARQANQQQRIDQGIASGQLDAAEASRLQRGQRRVQGMEDRAKADGVVTGRERARIHATQDRQSRRIYRQKHDGQVAR